MTYRLEIPACAGMTGERDRIGIGARAAALDADRADGASLRAGDARRRRHKRRCDEEAAPSARQPLDEQSVLDAGLAMEQRVGFAARPDRWW